MIQILISSLTVVLTGLGWVIARQIRRDAVMERIDRRMKLVSLHRLMQQSGLSVVDLHKIELNSSTKVDQIPISVLAVWVRPLMTIGVMSWGLPTPSVAPASHDLELPHLRSSSARRCRYLPRRKAWPSSSPFFGLSVK